MWSSAFPDEKFALSATKSATVTMLLGSICAGLIDDVLAVE